jgi:ParB family transcriptional regulator, chromosome partitioning protein
MRQALGKGIGALIPTASPRRSGGSGTLGAPSADAIAAQQNAVRFVSIDDVAVNPRQPRTRFDDHELDELARSIAESGVLQPILVRRAEGGRYELIAGERRLRACRQAGLREVPALVRETTDQESLMLAIVENVQRADLDPLEEAHAYQSLIDEFGLTQEEVARRVGKSRPAVTNSLRLLQLPTDAQEEIAAGRLSAGHARALLSVPSEDARRNLASEIVHRGLSVRDAERAARRGSPAPTPRRDPDLVRMEADLARALGTKVRIQTGRGGNGHVEIDFFSDDDLARLVERLSGSGGRRRSA